MDQNFHDPKSINPAAGGQTDADQQKKPVVIQPSSSFIAEMKTGSKDLPKAPISQNPPVSPAHPTYNDIPIPATPTSTGQLLPVAQKKYYKPILYMLGVTVIVVGTYLLVFHHSTPKTTKNPASSSISNIPGTATGTSTTTQQGIQNEENPLNSDPQLKAEATYCASSVLSC